MFRLKQHTAREALVKDTKIVTLPARRFEGLGGVMFQYEQSVHAHIDMQSYAQPITSASFIPEISVR